MSKIDAWKSIREETLQNLDIRAKYEEFGVKFTGKVSSSNWAECHAFGREDKSPSAAVNLTTGVYKDFAGERFSVFDFMVRHGVSPTWQEAQETLAKSVGLAKKIPKKSKAKRTEDLLGFTKTFTLVSVVPLARKYGINPKVIEMTGAKIARYPASSTEPQIVCAFPIFDAIALLESPPESYVLQSGSGQPIMVYQGPDVPAKPEKRITIGNTGILNKFALDHWEGAERIYKVEGLSDMLVLQDFIPEEFRTKHLVITNACGCDDAAPAWGLANHCTGKEMVIIHDADVPGQYGTGKDREGGAQRWIKALKSSARVLKNVQLPYEVASKHGKDLRNWIGESGRKYSDLLELVNSTRDEITNTVADGTGAVMERTPTQKVLDRLNICVLGHTSDRANSIVVFNSRLRRKFYISDIDKFSYNRMLMQIGDDAKNEIDPSPEPSPAKLSVMGVKQAIAYEACGRRVSRDSAIGVGIWEVNRKLIFVGSGEWMAMNGDLKVYSSPEIEDKLIDFADGKQSWFDLERIRGYLPHAMDSAWRTEFLKEFTGIFRRWDNWGETSEENDVRSCLIANLVLCSWIQDVWSWRPWIAITGETNSGKTTFFKLLGKYFGEQIALVVGDGSEAGLRQMLGTSSRIMLLDEFEASKERTKTLNWLKNSGAGSSSVRGTPGQHAVKASVKVMPWFGATEAGMKSETERNRYIHFNLATRVGKPRFSLPSDEDLEILRTKSLAVIMRCWWRAKELHEHLITNCQVDGIYSRYTESHALPVAMWSAIAGYDDLQAAKLFEKVLEPMLAGIRFQTESEHGTLLSEIATSRINIGRGEFRTVSELLTMVNHGLPGNSSETPDSILSRVGLRKMVGSDFKESGCGFKPDERILFICHKIVAKEMLRNGEFGEKGIDQILARVERSVKTKQRLGGASVRGIAVPLDAVIPFDSAIQKSDDFVPNEHRSISQDVFGS